MSECSGKEILQELLFHLPVIPAGARSFAFLGQFCELADDTIFTVEYSVRTAQTAVYHLLDRARAVTPI